MEKPLKILEAMDVYLPDVDGVIQCMHNYCLNLSKSNEVFAAVPKNKAGGGDDKFPYKIIRCKSIHIPILNQYYGFPKLDRKFKAELKKQDYDIIHLHSPFNMSSFLLKYAKKHNIPIVTTFHSNMAMIVKDVVKFKFLTTIFEKYLGRIYNKFDEVFCLSPLVEEQARHCGYKGKVTYLPFGHEFKRVDDVDSLRLKANEKLGLNEDDLVFLYVGRVMKLKRIDMIIKSLKILHDKNIAFKFYITGKGADLKKLKKLTHKLGLDDCIKFLGFVEREMLPLLYARSDLFLFPSLYDNFALVKVEAACYRTPGVFIKGSCAGYEIVDEENGYLSDDNVEAFAKRIEEAISDREKLRQVGINAQNTLGGFTWEESTKALLTRLNEIVRRKNDANKK